MIVPKASVAMRGDEPTLEPVVSCVLVVVPNGIKCWFAGFAGCFDESAIRLAALQEIYKVFYLCAPIRWQGFNLFYQQLFRILRIQVRYLRR
jgi:hypothetical protein